MGTKKYTKTMITAATKPKFVKKEGWADADLRPNQSLLKETLGKSKTRSKRLCLSIRPCLVRFLILTLPS